MRVVVIGSGLLGVTSAYFLARGGCEVTVLERESAPALGTSHANAGMLTPSMADPWNSPGVFWYLMRHFGREDSSFLVRPRALPSIMGWGLTFIAHSRPDRFYGNMEKNLRLGTYSLEVLRSLRTELGIAYDERTNGTLTIFRDQAALDLACERFERLAKMGLQVRVLDAKASVAVEPAIADIADQVAGGIHCPTDESGDARAFTVELARRAQGAGATFRFGEAVTGFERSGDRVDAVLTGTHKYPADAIVVAAGSWSTPLLAKLGIRLPVRPVKGYSITVPTGAWEKRPALPVIDAVLHAAITPMGERLRVAGTAEFAGYDTTPTPGRIDNLFHLLQSVYPSYAPHLDRAKASPWAGLRPVSADGVPRVGRMKLENLFVNAGHGHLGWTFAAGSGRLLTDLMLGKPTAINAKPYDAMR